MEILYRKPMYLSKKVNVKVTAITSHHNLAMKNIRSVKSILIRPFTTIELKSHIH